MSMEWTWALLLYSKNFPGAIGVARVGLTNMLGYTHSHMLIGQLQGRNGRLTGVRRLFVLLVPIEEAAAHQESEPSVRRRYLAWIRRVVESTKD